MPSSSYKLKRENTKKLTDKINKFVDMFTGTLDDLCSDPEEFLQAIDVTDNILTDGEMERMKDIMSSLRMKVQDTMRSHLINQIKKDESMLNAICSKMEVETSEDDVKKQRDAELRSEHIIQTDPTIQMLEKYIVKDDRCDIQVQLLTTMLLIGEGEDLRLLRNREQKEQDGLPTWLMVMMDGKNYIYCDKKEVNAELVGGGLGRLSFEKISKEHWPLSCQIWKAINTMKLPSKRSVESEPMSGRIVGYRWIGKCEDCVNIYK